MSVNADLERRLRSAGIETGKVIDPGEAWLRLHDAFGTRATLLDRYDLEAAALGIGVEDLSDDVRARLTREVTETHFPGFEVIRGSDRTARDPIDVVPYDSAWPARFATWRDRLQAELGAAALGIDHIGSTAVPGLPAKPVVDIHVTVADVENEASYVPAIERAGVALRSREVGHRYFRPAGDRPRDVQVHVTDAGSDWLALHLLFRDFLVAHASTRDEYGELKLQLASRYRDDRIAYNEAKTNFILDVLERAREWRAGSGSEGS
jgi:GrpB-like predicted nucleotidyltransferase (UPF0157 family)